MPDKAGRMTVQERRFVKHYAATNNVEYAAVKAGYAAPLNAYAKLKNPIIRDAVREASLELMNDIATMCLDRLKADASKPTTSTKDIVAIGKLVLPHVMGTADERSKDDHEKTFNELLAEAERRLNELKTIEGEVVPDPLEQALEQAPESGIFG